MRTISADNNAILTAGARSIALRLQVKDAGGTWRDLSTYPGVDLLESISWGETLDDPGVTWDAVLTREQESVSLAPGMTNSPLNRGFDPAASFAALLQVGRLMKVEYSMQGEDDPRARSWALAFSGYIVGVDAGGGDNVKLHGTGLEAAIQNCFIKRERVYAFAQGANADRGCYIWPDASAGSTYTTFAVGDRMIPTDNKRNGHFYRATSITTGIVGSTEPVWPTGSGATVVDGGVTWTESGVTSTSVGTAIETVMQQILDDNLGAGVVTLWCPVSPGWEATWVLIGRRPLFEELKAIADQKGWVFRYIDDAGTPRLKLFDPNRTTTTSLRSFGPAEVEDVKKLATDWLGIRNNIRIIYNDSQDLDASGNPKRKALDRTDATSITKYGDLYAEVAEASSSNIDTSDEARDLADAILSDLSEPTADLEAQLLYFFVFVELCDLYTFTADGVHFDVDQKLAVSSYRHQGDSSSLSTTIQVRGKPASNGKKGWFERLADAEGAEVHSLTLIDNSFTFVAAQTESPVGGAAGGLDWGGGKMNYETWFEMHLSTVNGFTPDNTTKKTVSPERSFNLGGLDPNQTYYAIYVPLTFNGRRLVRGQPSAQFTLQPGYLQQIHLNPETIKGPMPGNGGFEGWFRGSAFPPDLWELTTGTWGREIVRASGANARSGQYCVDTTTDTTTAFKLRSLFFPVSAGDIYALSAWVKKHGSVEAGDDLKLAIEWYGYDKALISTSSFTTDLNNLGTGWTNLAQNFAAPANSQYAKVFIAKVQNTDNFQCYIDDVSITESEPWHEIGATDEPAFEHSWVNYNSGTHATAAFVRDGVWRVLKGLIKDGTTGDGNQAFTLPVGDRPTLNQNYAVVTDTGHGRVEVQSSGEVTILSGGTGFLSLDGIRWRVS